MSRNYGYHLHEVVADVHRSVTNLTEQDKENRHQQLTQWHTTDRTTPHISELAVEVLEAELAGDEAIPEQLAWGGGDPVLAANTAAWLAAEAATTQRWIAADAVAGAHQAVADTQRLHAQRAERWLAAHWLAADDHAGTVGDEVELGSHDQALPPA